MKAIKLTSEDGKHSASVCGICKRLCSAEYAEECCTCTECGELVPENQGHYTRLHRECQQMREQRRMEKAKEVPYEGGFVFCEEFDGYKNGYFDDMNELQEYIEDDCDASAEWPEFVFACKMKQHEYRLDREIEHICDSGYEEMYDHLDVPRSLTAGVKEFNEINHKALQVWHTDYSEKYRVPQPTPTE